MYTGVSSPGEFGSSSLTPIYWPQNLRLDRLPALLAALSNLRFCNFGFKIYSPSVSSIDTPHGSVIIALAKPAAFFPYGTSNFTPIDESLSQNACSPAISNPM